MSASTVDSLLPITCFQNEIEKPILSCPFILYPLLSPPSSIYSVDSKDNSNSFLSNINISDSFLSSNIYLVNCKDNSFPSYNSFPSTFSKDNSFPSASLTVTQFNQLFQSFSLLHNKLSQQSPIQTQEVMNLDLKLEIVNLDLSQQLSIQESCCDKSIPLQKHTYMYVFQKDQTSLSDLLEKNYISFINLLRVWAGKKNPYKKCMFFKKIRQACLIF
jgi:hypothetical protein